jgi:class 3 adenylate cyclase
VAGASSIPLQARVARLPQRAPLPTRVAARVRQQPDRRLGGHVPARRGDEVNIAARLEALNKDYGTTIIVSESTRERAGAERFDFALLDEARVRGRTTSSRIYRVGGR